MYESPCFRKKQWPKTIFWHIDYHRLTYIFPPTKSFGSWSRCGSALASSWHLYSGLLSWSATILDTKIAVRLGITSDMSPTISICSVRSIYCHTESQKSVKKINKYYKYLDFVELEVVQQNNSNFNVLYRNETWTDIYSCCPHNSCRFCIIFYVTLYFGSFLHHSRTFSLHTTWHKQAASSPLVIGFIAHV